ncbi:hypothetical protein A2U01_0079013, partial [Trifolium medium]|nr:hypothetical protein [Trifolium medium]
MATATDEVMLGDDGVNGEGDDGVNGEV